MTFTRPSRVIITFDRYLKEFRQRWQRAVPLMWRTLWAPGPMVAIPRVWMDH